MLMFLNGSKINAGQVDLHHCYLLNLLHEMTVNPTFAARIPI